MEMGSEADKDSFKDILVGDVEDFFGLITRGFFVGELSSLVASASKPGMKPFQM